MPLFGKEHVERYEATDGKEGYDWENGTTILLLHTTGRKSGKERIHPLIYRDWEDTYLIVASKGGDPDAPEWFKNIEKNPDVEIQIKADTFPVHARVATAEEKPAMWKHMTEVWPSYEEYQGKTDREIPVVVLERA
ncbi:nitroreductase family deazaflavin-dependent oxidoreductase [uncultured Jatrophihabitans sp.]|uniref:nitroreductase family deazaflavin-dependent oxidoreductase n=1 Tax=uncultured Jatrophihabitans sp. TaxID=1610747 RepID=UPI0035CAF3B1